MTRDDGARELSVDGQDLTIGGGCQGYMDFFSEVFCVVFFLFKFLHTTKYQDVKRYQRLKERTNTQRYFSKRSYSQSACFSVFMSSFP